MEVRLEPFSIVTAVLAVIALGISLHLAFAHDRPSALPEHEPGGAETSIGCEELPRWMERTAEQGYPSLVRVRGYLAFRRDDALPRLGCDRRTYVLQFADPPDVTPGGVLVRITPDGRLVAPIESSSVSPRADARAAHQHGTWLGIAAVLLAILTWARRPFDPLRDHVGDRAPASSIEIEPRSNDRLVADERELSHRFLAMIDGQLREALDSSGAHIGLPGAEQRYREAAGGDPYVRGPALVNGLHVARGSATPLCDGDVVQLGPSFSPVRITLPRAGAALRYLASNGTIRLAIRVRDARAFGPVAAATLLGVLAAVTLHADFVLHHAAAAPLALAAVLVARRVPALLGRRVETLTPLAEVLAGRVSISVRDEGQLGRSVLVDGRPAGRIPPVQGAAKPARAALEAAIGRELELLTRERVVVR